MSCLVERRTILNRLAARARNLNVLVLGHVVAFNGIKN
jgi:hypothetical protein